MTRWIIRGGGQGEGCVWDDLPSVDVLLAAGLPSPALQILLGIRPRGTHHWQDQTCSQRLLSAARAHEALHRPRLALALYEKSLSGCECSGNDHSLARARIAHLRAGIQPSQDAAQA